MTNNYCNYNKIKQKLIKNKQKEEDKYIKKQLKQEEKEK